MRNLVLAAVATVVPVLLSAQTLEPRRAAAGTEVTVTEDCAATPVILLDTTSITSVGKDATNRWRFTLPALSATFTAKPYSVKWRCGTNADKDLGQLEVTRPGAAGGSGSTAAGGSATGGGAGQAGGSSGGTQQTAPAEPIVVKVHNETKNADGTTAATELKDVLNVTVNNFKVWRDKNAATELHLYLAGTELKSVVGALAPKGKDDPADSQVLKFTLEVDKEGEGRKAWAQVLRTAWERKPRYVLDLTVGPDKQAPWAVQGQPTIALHVYPWYTGFVVAFLLLVAAAIVWLGASSNMLRDRDGSNNPPYSLAKHQMAIWFFVVIGSYLYVWLITGLGSAISTTALTLIGISGATGLIAVTMDANKKNEAVTTRIAMQAERDALAKTLTDPVTGLQVQLRAAAAGSPEATQLAATITPKQARLEELDALLRAAPPVLAPVKRRWPLDLLSDENGVSFHRLQMALWTVVLVMVFIRAVYMDTLMPDFDGTLLGLMGISSGTYLGFKFPEKKTA